MPQRARVELDRVEADREDADMVVPCSRGGRCLADSAAGVGAVREDDDRAGADVRHRELVECRFDSIVDVRPGRKGGRGA